MEGQHLGRVCSALEIRAAVETVGETPVGVGSPWPLPANAATVPCTLGYDDGRPAETAMFDYLHYSHQALPLPA